MMFLSHEQLYPLALSTVAGLSTTIGAILAVLVKPTDSALAFLLGVAFGVMMTVSMVELFIRNAIENDAFLVTAMVLLGGMVYYIIDPLLDFSHKLEEEPEPQQDDLDIEVVGASTEGSSSRWMARANGLKPIRSSRSQVSSTGPKQPASGSPLAAMASLPFSSEDLQLQPPPSRTGSTLATNPAELMRLGMLMAVTMTLHNLPEGFAVAFSAYTEMGLIMALAIAVHNIPEGIIVAAPIYAATGSRLRAIGMATASGLSEPLGAFIALAFVQPFVGNVRSSLDYVLAFVGGVMISVCLLELWPEARKCRDDKRMMQGIMLGSLVMGWTLYVGV